MKLCFPLNYVYVTQKYSTNHPAIDLGWKDNPNMPIIAIENGVVSNIYTDDAYGGGLSLTIKYSDGYVSTYMHLSKILVKIGDKVNKFQEVALMGNSGWSTTGPHLHFILTLNGNRVDPLKHCYIYSNQEYSESQKNLFLFYEGSDNMKFKIGDKVLINGNLFPSSDANTATSKVTNRVTEITRVAVGSKHPYNTTGDLGWMNESAISLYSNVIDYKTLYEEELSKNKQLQDKINAAIEILK